MKKSLMIPVLSAALVCGRWASAQPETTPAPPPPAGQEAGNFVYRAAGGSLSGSGIVTVQAVAAPLAPGAAQGPIIISRGGPVPPGMPMPPALPGMGPGFGPGERPQTIAIRRVPDGAMLSGPPPMAMQVQGFRGNPPMGMMTATAFMPGKTEKTAFLGVATAHASGTLRSQLKLKAGLVVEMVEPKSSAEAAGLKVHDVIEKLDDQWLINPAQFVGLIRMHKPGETVTLSIIREGARKQLATKLEERESYVMDEDEHNFTYSAGGAFDPNNPGGPVSAFTKPTAAFAEPGVGPVQQITAGALGAAPLSSGFIATFGDDKQEVSISLHDGHQILTAKDATGKQIFQGPIDTAEQRKLLPPDVRARLEEMEKIKVRFRTTPSGPMSIQVQGSTEKGNTEK